MSIYIAGEVSLPILYPILPEKDFELRDVIYEENVVFVLSRGILVDAELGGI
ncbi:MAG: hypothetical protein ACK4G3_03180 [bacterium]